MKREDIPFKIHDLVRHKQKDETLFIEALADSGFYAAGTGFNLFKYEDYRLLFREGDHSCGSCQNYKPPKKVVVKTVELWCNTYPVQTEHTYYSKQAYFSKQGADNAAGPSRIACVKLTGTYEVEE